MISPLLKNLRTTLWSMLPKTSETTHRMSTSRPHVRGTLMSELSPAIAVFLMSTILTCATATAAEDAGVRATLPDSANTKSQRFVTGPVPTASLPTPAEPMRPLNTMPVANPPKTLPDHVNTSARSITHVYRETNTAPLTIPDAPSAEDTWHETYVEHVADVLQSSTSRPPHATVGDWWRQRLPYVEFVTVEPSRLKESARDFINQHTLPPEHAYDVDVYDQRPISVASSQTVTVVEPLDANPAIAQDASDLGKTRLRTDIREIRPTLGYAMRNIDAGQLPEGFNEKLDQGDYIARQSSPAVLQWAPTNLYHNPLYFEDPALERYGHTYPPVVQPFASAGRFATQLVGLPYQMSLHPVHSREYTLGYYRPGECAPKKHYQIPFNEEAAFVQAAAMAGFFLIFP